MHIPFIRRYSWAVALLFGLLWLVSTGFLKSQQGGWPGSREVKAKHFSFITDLDDKAFVDDLITHLDGLYDAFTDEFKSILNKEPRFKNPVVYFYKRKQDYLTHVRKFHPGYEKLPGFYFSTDRIAHFYYRRDQPGVTTNRELMLHECTHQLVDMFIGLSLAYPPKPGVWVTEGIACYFETLQMKDGKPQLGDTQQDRLVDGKKIVAQKSTVPLAQFLRFNQQQLTFTAKAPRYYSQAAGLFHFLMHGKDGKYKEPLKKYVLEVHQGHGRVGLFEEIFHLQGDGLKSLEQEWIQYMKELQ